MLNNKRRRLIPPGWGACSLEHPESGRSFSADYLKTWQNDSRARTSDHPEPVQTSVSNPAWVAAQPDGPTVPFAPSRCLWPSPSVLDFLASQIDAIEDRNLEPLLQLFEQSIEPSLASSSGVGPGVTDARTQVCASAMAQPAPSDPEASSSACRGGHATVLPLDEPLLLCGHQGDHLEGHAGLLPHWEKLGLEPAGSPKTVQYTVLVPDDLAPMARPFLRDVGAAYAALGAGSHLPASSCTMLRRVSGIAPIPRTSPAGSSAAAGSSRGGSGAAAVVQPVVHPVTGPVTNHMQGFYPGAHEPLIQLLPQQPTTPQLPESAGSSMPPSQAGAARPGSLKPMEAAAGARSAPGSLAGPPATSPPGSRATTPAPQATAGVTMAGGGGGSAAGDAWWLNLRYTLDMLQRSLVANRPRLGYAGGRSLGPEGEADAAYVVYVVPPTNNALDALRCLLEAAARLAPVTAVGAATVSAAACAAQAQASSTGAPDRLGEGFCQEAAGAGTGDSTGSAVWGAGGLGNASMLRQSQGTTQGLAAGLAAASSAWPAGSTYGAGREGNPNGGGGAVTAAPLGLGCTPRVGPSALQVELGLLAKELALVQQYGGAARDLYTALLPSADGTGTRRAGNTGTEGGPPPTNLPTGATVGLGPGARGATPMPFASAGTPAPESFRAAALSGGAAAAAAVAAAGGVWAGSVDALLRSRPLDITLQLVLPSMLTGVDAGGARATALSVYNKVRRLASRVTGATPAGVTMSATQRLRAPQPLPTHLPAPTAATSSSLTLLYEPLLSLAAEGSNQNRQGGSQLQAATPAAQEAAAAADAAATSDAADGGPQPLVLHCAYEYKACGGREHGMEGTWVALCWVDGTGQLLERRTVMLRPTSAAMSATEAPPVDSRAQPRGPTGARPTADSSSRCGNQSLEHLVCSAVLHHSLMLLQQLQSTMAQAHGSEQAVSSAPGVGAMQTHATGAQQSTPRAPTLIVTRAARRLPAGESAAWAALLSPSSMQQALNTAEHALRAAHGSMSLASPPAPGTPGTPDTAAPSCPRVIVTSVTSHSGDESLGLDPVHAVWPQGTVLICAEPPRGSSTVSGAPEGSHSGTGGQQPGMKQAASCAAHPAAAVLSFPSPVSACALAARAPCVQHWAMTLELDTHPGQPLVQAPAQLTTQAQQGLGAADVAQPVVASIAQQLHGLTSLAAAYRVAHAGHGTTPHGLTLPGAMARTGPVAASRPLLPLHCQAARQLLALCATAHVTLVG